MKQFDVQVKKDHYYDNYDNLPRFISYFYQIKLVKELNPKKALEIGIGNKTVSNYLKQSGMDIKTCDFDKKLGPDYIADIRNLPFKDNSFDLIIACEVLEHMPYDAVEKALSELARVSKSHVIISIPYYCLFLSIALKFPLLYKFFKLHVTGFNITFPMFFSNIKFNGEHYWEMGRKGYSKTNIRKLIKGNFKIMKELSPFLDPMHYFFVLKKK